MGWVHKHKLPAIEAVKYNSYLCLEINDLWFTLHLLFNMALDQCIEEDILDKVLSFISSFWKAFFEKEFISSIARCNNSSTPGPDKLLWRHLKHIIKDKICLKNIINIANMCIKLSHWPLHFKMSMTIVIPKLNKVSYNSPKLFRPIVLLNTIGKLIKKVISDRLQFYLISNNFIHQCQLGSLKFKATSDADIALTHFICMGWVKNLPSSILVFDISQLFPSLNNCLLLHILGKACFDSKVIHFFSNYLIDIDRKTQYFWNNFSSPLFSVDVRVGQGSVLSPILSALYLAPVLHILEKHLKNLKIPISMLSFVNNGLFIIQSKSFSFLNSLLFCSYNITSILLWKFGLTLEHSKTKVFHFSRLHGTFNPPPLDFSVLGAPILYSKEVWKYLGFIFDRKLTFC